MTQHEIDLLLTIYTSGSRALTPALLSGALRGPPSIVLASARRLEAMGLVDAGRLRLTMHGLAVAAMLARGAPPNDHAADVDVERRAQERWDARAQPVRGSVAA